MSEEAFLLIHSPLVGPLTWRPILHELTRRGRRAIVPDLRSAATTGRIEAIIDVATTGPGPARPSVVGHSGAGFLLPFVVERLDAERVVFVDAGVPPCTGTATPGGDFLPQLREMAVDGLVPRWSAWWPPELLHKLLPDDDLRAAFEAELPSVPLGLYETAIPLPDGWCSRAAGYLQLSEAYATDAATARAGGWRTIERNGDHLDIVTKPAEIADDLLRLLQ